MTIDPELPPPFEVPWTMKPLESAETHVEVLPDGRRKYAIVHDVVRDVTPAMIVWWLKHMDGEVEIAGRVIPRYRAWHPRDHVSVRYARRAHDGSNMGPGSRVHIRESFGREARYRVDVVDDVLRLDEGGFVHVHRRAGVELLRMEYTSGRQRAKWPKERDRFWMNSRLNSRRLPGMKSLSRVSFRIRSATSVVLRDG